MDSTSSSKGWGEIGLGLRFNLARPKVFTQKIVLSHVNLNAFPCFTNI